MAGESTIQLASIGRYVDLPRWVVDGKRGMTRQRTSAINRDKLWNRPAQPTSYNQELGTVFRRHRQGQGSWAAVRVTKTLARPRKSADPGHIYWMNRVDYSKLILGMISGWDIRWRTLSEVMLDHGAELWSTEVECKIIYVSQERHNFFLLNIFTRYRPSSRS